MEEDNDMFKLREICHPTFILMIALILISSKPYTQIDRIL